MGQRWCSSSATLRKDFVSSSLIWLRPRGPCQNDPQTAGGAEVAVPASVEDLCGVFRTSDGLLKTLGGVDPADAPRRAAALRQLGDATSNWHGRCGPRCFHG